MKPHSLYNNNKKVLKVLVPLIVFIFNGLQLTKRLTVGFQSVRWLK